MRRRWITRKSNYILKPEPLDQMLRVSQETGLLVHHHISANFVKFLLKVILSLMKLKPLLHCKISSESYMSQVFVCLLFRQISIRFHRPPSLILLSTFICIFCVFNLHDSVISVYIFIHLHYWRNESQRYFKTGSWGEYLGPKEMRM